MSKKGSVKIIDGVNVSYRNFGIRKEALKTIAKAEDIQAFMNLLDKKEALFEAARKRAREQDRSWYYAKPTWSDLHPIDTQLRGFRKYWRCEYTDSFSDGLYIARTNLSWEYGKCVGEFGSSYLNKTIPKGTVFLYVQHDRMGNVELMHSTSSEVIKITRGSSSCDKFVRHEKEKTNDTI